MKVELLNKPSTEFTDLAIGECLLIIMIMV